MSIQETLTKWAESNNLLRIAILFGSYATSKNHDNSDVDVAVLFDKVLSLQEKVEVTTELSTLLKKEIDLIDLLDCNGELLKQVLTTGIRLKTDENMARLLQKMLYQQSDFEPIATTLRKNRKKRLIDE